MVHLEALSRVLELLSRYFKDSLGDQLLRHLQKWCTPKLIIQTNKWKKGREPAVAAKMIELFQLLPESTNFLDRLIQTVLQLENVIHQYRDRSATDSVGCSPYRRPLIGYLNRYANGSIKYFLSSNRLSNPRMAVRLIFTFSIYNNILIVTFFLVSINFHRICFNQLWCLILPVL